MKYTCKNAKGETIPYKFPNKKEEEEYIAICTDIWGCVPLDVNWAKQTKPYQNYKNRGNENN